MIYTKTLYGQLATFGLAIFAMFFGAGNLVFPLQIGLNSGSDWLSGFSGLWLTGILIPLMGLMVIKLHRGHYETFFGEAGTWMRFLFPLFALSLLGSFGVIPRCITVAHGGIAVFWKSFPLELFSFFFSIATFLFCLKDEKMISLIGKWMSPLLIGGLLLIISIGIWKAPSLADPLKLTEFSSAFAQGFTTGYQTMDLFAAFFFSALTFKQIEKCLPENVSQKALLKFALSASLMAALLLSIIYASFTYLGAHYAHIIAHIDPALMLPTIAQAAIGIPGAIIIGMVMILSCLTTAVALNNIYARYLCRFFQCHDCRFPWFLLATTTTSFCISLLDFQGIAALLKPPLAYAYPAMIALTIMALMSQKRTRLKKAMFWSIVFMTILMTIIWK